MSLFKKIVDIAGGDIFGKIVDTAKDYFPPSMSPQEKSDLQLKMSEVAHAQELSLLNATNHMEAEFNQRIKDMEGTASDLKTIPFIGPIIIFLRGLQRPVWGFATLYMDFKVFAGEWTLIDGSKQDLAFFAINLLVLGFLFGERAIKNVGPIIERMIKK
jgi:hypothetical protein